MKKVFYPLAIIAIVSILSSCAPKPEELILGTWTLEKAEVENVDEIIETVLKDATTTLDEQITQLEASIGTLEADENQDETTAVELEMYKAQLEELKYQKTEMTAEKLKADFEKNYEGMKGMQLQFNEDKTYKSINDATEGTWSISEDATNLTITQEGSDVTFNIAELTDTKLAINYEETRDNITIKMATTFTKGETTTEGGDDAHDHEEENHNH